MAVFQNPERVIERVIGNTEPFAAQLLDMDGEAVDLTGLTIACRMVRQPSGKVVINDEEATIEDAELGRVSYTPDAADVSIPGRHAVYFLDKTVEPYKRYPYDGAKYVINLKKETDG